MKIGTFLFFGTTLALLTISVAKPSETQTHTGSSTSKGGAKHDEGSAVEEHDVSTKTATSSKHDHEEGKHGSQEKDVHKVKDADEGGKKHKHFHADKHEMFHKSGGQQAHGAQFEEGSKRHKGNYKKGFVEKFHKDELMKHDSFFKNGERSGSYTIFGKKGAKYGSQSIAKKAGGSFKSLDAENKHGKSSKKVGGHNKSSKKGRKSSKTSASNYANNQKFAKKGGKKGGKHYKVKH